MLCDRCKERQATITISEVLDNKQTKLFLCETCAKEMEGIIFNNPFEAFLGGLINEREKKEQPKILQCNNCGMTLEEFKKTSKMGCANCFTSFYDYIIPILKRMQGSVVHVGKFPKEQQDEIETINTIALLKIKLKKAIEEEAYEEAAELRDQIKALKEGGIVK